MAVVPLQKSVVITPERSPAPAIVFYGGLYGLEGAWLVHKIPQYMQQSVAFVLPRHYTTDCTACLNELHSQFAAEKISSYSLCGFSRGAIEVYRYRDLKSWKILGLVDPSAPTLGGFDDAVLDSQSSKIRCVYWVPNWGKDGYGGRVPRFAQHLRDLKVNMKEQATEHASMPVLFFDVFHKELMS